jgi:arylsulfatase A-like enzyme
LNELETIFTGVRTSDWKLIEERPLANPQQIESVELYDLTADPEETAPLEESTPATDAIREELHQFLAEAKYGIEQYAESADRTVDDSVERRLSELGYR